MATLPQYTDTSVYLPNYTPPKINSSGSAQVKAKPVVTTPQPAAVQNITPIPTSSAMGSGMAMSGLSAAAPAGYAGYGSTPTPVQTQPSGLVPGQPNLASQSTYRQDAGQYMTDADYTKWKQQQPVDQLKATTGVQTDATKGLMDAQASIAASQAAAERAYQEQMAATQHGYGTADMTQQAGIQSAAAQQQQQFALAQMEEEARLRQEAAARQMSYFPQLLAQLDASGGGPQSTSMGMSPQEEEARRLAFTRAREQSGGTALASLRALGDFSAQNGQTGSSMERQMQGGIIGGAAHDVNNFTTDQAIADVNRAAGISDRDFAGNLTRRGQNLSVATNFLNGLRY